MPSSCSGCLPATPAPMVHTARPGCSAGLHPYRVQSILGGRHHLDPPGRACSLAVVLDVFCRHIGGGSMATQMRTTLGLDALNVAYRQRRPQGKSHHSDRGSKCPALTSKQRCAIGGVRPSHRAFGSAYDSTMAEICFATLAYEILDRRCFQIEAEPRAAILRIIEGW